METLYSFLSFPFLCPVLLLSVLCVGDHICPREKIPLCRDPGLPCLSPSVNHQRLFKIVVGLLLCYAEAQSPIGSYSEKQLLCVAFRLKCSCRDACLISEHSGRWLSGGEWLSMVSLLFLGTPAGIPRSSNGVTFVLCMSTSLICKALCLNPGNDASSHVSLK